MSRSKQAKITVKFEGSSALKSAEFDTENLLLRLDWQSGSTSFSKLTSYRFTFFLKEYIANGHSAGRAYHSEIREFAEPLSKRAQEFLLLPPNERAAIYEELRSAGISVL